MKKIIYVLTFHVLACGVYAQSDTIVERNVTVEREFTPVIQEAGKIQTRPDVYNPAIQKQEVDYVTGFNKPLDIQNDFSFLPYADMNFVQPRLERGFLRGGVGVWNSLFDFKYRMSDKNDVFFDAALDHNGLWGNKTLSQTGLDLAFEKLFSNAGLFCSVGADNTWFNYYGRYYDNQQNTYDFTRMSSDTALYGRFWNIDTRIGVRSLPMSNVDFLVQAGYEMFNTRIGLTEHQVHTQASVEWELNNSRLGATTDVQNLFYASQDTALSVRAHHIWHLEPYYVYEGDIFRLHAGVNFDFSFGKGPLFRPSPNVDFEVRLAPKWLAFYGGVTGEYKVNTLETTMQENRYLLPQIHVCDTLNTYTPANGFLGFKLKPHDNLQINAYAKYAYTFDQYYYVFDTQGSGMFSTIKANTACFKAGAALSYHYQDIVNVSVDGSYNYWQAEGQLHAWDRPAWEIHASVYVKATDKLSFYTDNYFNGKRYALLSSGETALLKPVYDVNIGASYAFSRWFSAFLKLNNLVHNRYEVFYGYQVQGINFLAGVSWAF